MNEDPHKQNPEQEDFLAINGYRLLREITEGGQSIRFQALQESTGRTVAFKLIPSGPLAGKRERNRMEKKVRLLVLLDHPNIVNVIDKGTNPDGSAYFFLDYIQDVTLSECVDSYYPRSGS